jgi:hypothetical protein
MRLRSRSLFQMKTLPRLAPSVHAALLDCARVCGLESEEALRTAVLRCGARLPDASVPHTAAPFSQVFGGAWKAHARVHTAQ